MEWFEKDSKDSRLTLLLEKFTDLKAQEQSRRDDYLGYLKIYSGRSFDDNFTILSRPYINPDFSNIPSYNASRQCCDTLKSKLGKNKPRTKVLPVGGDYQVKDEAQKLEKYLQGINQTNNLYEISRSEVLLNALLFGTGVWQIFAQDGNVKIEAVPSVQILVDKREGKYKNPRQILRYSPVSRDLLKKRFPKFKSDIETAPQFYSSTSEWQESTYDEVELVEAWHLPSGEKAKDGRHCVFLENKVIIDEEYNRDKFPFVFYNFSDVPFSFWGQGVIEQVLPLQAKLNQVNYTIDSLLENASSWLLVDDNADVNIEHLGASDEILAIRYNRAGNKPEIVRNNPIPEQLLQERSETYQKCFEIVGLSELSVAAKKPSGLDSGVALQEYNDIESERFMDQALSWEEAFMEISKHVIDVSKEIASDPNYKEIRATIKGEDFFESIDWNEIDLEEDQYSLGMHPASMFPTTPAGKLQKVSTMLQANLISQNEARELILETPDLERFADIEYSTQNILQKTIDKMVRTGEYVAVEPFDDLDFAEKYAIKAYNQARLDEAPEESLEALRQYIQDCIARKEELAAKQAANQAPPMPPEGAPMPPQGPEGMPPMPGGPLPPGMPPGPELGPMPQGMPGGI